MSSTKFFFFFLIGTVTFGLVVSLWWYLYYASEPSWKTVFVESSIEDIILSPCSRLDDRGFNTWEKGSVTVMKPQISKNCSLLFEGDLDEVNRVRNKSEKWKSTEDSKEFYEWTLSGNCTRIRNQFLNNFYVSKEELTFQLAFSLNIHDNPQQVVRLLKVIYRPHNLYCIHYDMKSSSEFKQIFNNIAKCLSNFFISSKIIKVNWGDYTILDAQLNCIRDLYNARLHFRWKYLITLCGKELPLRTNLEIVRLLQPLNGTSALVHFELPDEDKWRVEVKSYANSRGRLVRTRRKLGPIPHNLKIYKSLAYFGLTPEFVGYILHDSIAQDLLYFMHRGVSSAEEHFYSTLYLLPDTPGGYRKEVAELIPTIVSAIWLPDEGWESRCSGWFVHWICIVSSGDLHRVKNFLRSDANPHTQGAMFHNKYFMEKDHVVMDCVEEELVKRNKEEYEKDCTSYLSSKTKENSGES